MLDSEHDPGKLKSVILTYRSAGGGTSEPAIAPPPPPVTQSEPDPHPHPNPKCRSRKPRSLNPKLHSNPTPNSRDLPNRKISSPNLKTALHPSRTNPPQK